MFCYPVLGVTEWSNEPPSAFVFADVPLGAIHYLPLLVREAMQHLAHVHLPTARQLYRSIPRGRCQSDYLGALGSLYGVSL
jgi:hypothetical protein